MARMIVTTHAEVAAKRGGPRAAVQRLQGCASITTIALAGLSLHNSALKLRSDLMHKDIAGGNSADVSVQVVGESESTDSESASWRLSGSFDTPCCKAFDSDCP